MIDIQKLMYLHAIVENNFNITTAANKLFISQPALSQMISTLEHDEDFNLFVRHKGRICGLTYIGQKLYHESVPLIRHYHSMINQLENLKAKQKENYAIAASPLLFSSFLLDLIQELRDNFPSVTFSFIEIDADRAKQRLSNRHYNFALLDDPLVDTADNCLFSDVLTKSVYIAFLSRNHPLKERLVLNWKEISQYPIAVPSGLFPTAQLIADSIHRLNRNPFITLESISWEVHRNCLLKDSNAISILPKFISNAINPSDKAKIITKEINDSSFWYIKLFRSTIKCNTLIEGEIYHFILSYFKDGNSSAHFTGVSSRNGL